MKAKTCWWTVALGSLLAVGLLPGCEVGSPDTVEATANGDFSGRYANGSSPMVNNNSGNAINTMALNQSGNQLQAVDNNGILFKGTIGDILNSSASFTLNGVTTAGQTVAINGTLRAVGTTASLSGIWAEPGVYSSIYGTASIGAITNAPTPTGAVARVLADLQRTPQ
ncbi:MAG: hypothetical protein NTY53_11180 [Kiritimatiellaeota bacterium]|nr:hypothetical protein [Kiritimatiellota bacterium]